MLIHDALDTIPFVHIEWTPYAGEVDADQPWVEQGRPYFGREIWLHAFNTVVPLHLRLVTDWRERVGEQLEDWRQWGRVVISEATSDEDYFCAYARRYGAQHVELERAQQMVGGASTSRDEPSRSVLEDQLAMAVRRVEEATAELQEREADLRASLARTAALEKEMAEMCLRPQTDKATRLGREVDELYLQLGSERHRYNLLRSEMKGLERALALVGRSRTSASRSGIPSGSDGHYLTGSSRRRRNDKEARRREGAAEGSTTGPKDMAPPPSRPPEGTGESD
ncbi:hypothetical protein Taro_004324 [Colocasia esculenta]|uniref:Uncharacterized protein n=1 Tax=Colocasia esculenta TaxID=4460 RepID=A0A843TPP8_COLES|nr:hypothetical protein [Colocasia esculenta]